MSRRKQLERYFKVQYLLKGFQSDRMQLSKVKYVPGKFQGVAVQSRRGARFEIAPLSSLYEHTL